MKKKKVTALLIAASITVIATACGNKEEAQTMAEIPTVSTNSPYTLVDEKDEVEITQAQVSQNKGNGTGAEAPEFETIEDVAYANQILMEENPDDYKLSYLIMYTIADVNAYAEPNDTSEVVAELPKATSVAVWSQDETGMWAAIKYNSKDCFVDKAMLADKLETAKNAPPVEEKEQTPTEQPQTPAEQTPSEQTQTPAEQTPVQEQAQTPAQPSEPQAPAGGGMDFSQLSPEDQAKTQELINMGLIEFVEDDGSQMKVWTQEELDESMRESEEYIKNHPNLRFE